VANFEITAIKEGFSTISLQIDNSSLLDANNTDVLKSTGTPLNFVISNTAITITPTQPVPTPTGVLPRNGLIDSIGAANAFITGTILIAVGAYLYKLQRHAKRRFSEERPILNTLINITVLSDLGTVTTQDYCPKLLLNSIMW